MYLRVNLKSLDDLKKKRHLQAQNPVIHGVQYITPQSFADEITPGTPIYNLCVRPWL